MIYAIDRYGVGLEKEVKADTFYNKYIAQKNNRFFCPECGEPVFWSSRGGSLPDRFSHYKRTERTPECEKRVDGYSELNLYERVGLPVYLTAKFGNQFCLNIGFPAIGRQLLSEASEKGMKVCISGAEHRKTILVNSVRFLEDNITLIPIDFIPDSGKNFVVKIEPQVKGVKLRKEWADYAEGFWGGGAIFTYRETGGKKIRRGDSVSPGRQYYVIASQFLPPHEICSKELGMIRLNRSSYKVYSIHIDVSIENIERYKYIKNYLLKQFGVWLLPTPPELIPLWPPIAEQGVMIPVKSQARVYCSVSSGNNDPSVFRYDGHNVSSLFVDSCERGIHTVDFAVSSQEVILSVDRKYAGREIGFQAKEIVYPVFEYNFSVGKENGSLLEWKDVTRDILSEAFILNSNARMEMYIGCQDKVFRHISVREPRVPVATWRNTSEVLIVVEGGVLKYFQVSAANKPESFKKQLTVEKIGEYSGGEQIPVPYWVANMLLAWRREGNIDLFEEVKRRIGNGKISVRLLDILYHDYCARGNRI